MTKDLALLVGPEQKWLSTEGFLDKIDDNLKQGDGVARRPSSGRAARVHLLPSAGEGIEGFGARRHVNPALRAPGSPNSPRRASGCRR